MQVLCALEHAGLCPLDISALSNTRNSREEAKSVLVWVLCPSITWELVIPHRDDGFMAGYLIGMRVFVTSTRPTEWISPNPSILPLTGLITQPGEHSCP